MFEEALGVVQRRLGTLACLETQGLEVLQRTEKAEASTTLPDSTRHDDDDEGGENQGGG